MHTHSRKQSVDTATHNAEGKWGRRGKKEEEKKTGHVYREGLK